MSGRKVWEAGDVLAALDVMDYLMDQACMVFASSAARDSEIPSPTAGMLTYRTDGGLELYNGSAWVSANSVGGSVIASDVTGALSAATINNTAVTNTLTNSASTTYTLASADQGTTVRLTNAGTATVTVGTAAAFTAGQRVDLIADGALGIVAAGSGVTFGGAGTSGTAYSFSTYEAVSVLCVASNTYRIIGNITAV